MEIAAFRALFTPAGQRLLATACADYDEAKLVTLGTALRREHPAELVAAALTQAELRRRAHAKFGADADAMYFTPDGLEQATRTVVAAHRADRFAPLRPDSTVDLGCGIGGDLLALARAGIDVTGIDLDPLRVAVANANLDALGLTASARARTGDAEQTDLGAYDTVFADPARRSDRGRVFNPDAYRPPWSFVTRLLTRDACVKVAPGIPHRLVPDDVEAEWVSDRGEVKEAALWSGRLRTDARRRATVLPAGASLTDADPATTEVAAAGAYLYEPDGAVIRAGLVAAVAAQVSGGLLDPHLAYVTSDAHVSTPFATAFGIEEVLPYDLRAIRAALRKRAVGTLTIKKRGIDVDPQRLRHKLRTSGPNAATVVLARVESGALALIVERLPAGL